MTVRTRFAPSPTGFLHMGGARTALFSWLYAKKMQGKFLLRVEDTDRERSTQEAVNAIFDGMSWLNMESDERVEYQTHRFDRYREVANQLLEEGKAYRCDCHRERLEALREQQMQAKQKPRYDGCCRDKNLDASTAAYVIRFKNPKEGTVVVNDKVYGEIKFENTELDDLIIVRTDGTPTYNFCVVVDDWDMQITHVIRGDDHLNNTPRQINILKALDAPIPVYAHVPMILGEDGKKLSKRHGALGVMYYRDSGILPEAMINYLARLGWSHGDQELFTTEELISLFDINDLNKSPAALSLNKLLWVNQHYLKTSPLETIKEHLAWHIAQAGIDVSTGPAIDDVIELQRGRVKTLKELVEKSLYFYEDVFNYDEKAAGEFLTKEAKYVLRLVLEKISNLSQWTKDDLQKLVQSVLIESELKMPKVAQPLRVALTGNTLSPSIDVTLYYIGQTRVQQRIEKAIAYIDKYIKKDT